VEKLLDSASAYRPLRGMQSLVNELDAVIEEFSVRRLTLSRLHPREQALLITDYLERLSSLLAEDLPHFPPPELHPSLRKN
jgi:hypothetical protein